MRFDLRDPYALAERPGDALETVEALLRRTAAQAAQAAAGSAPPAVAAVRNAQLPSAVLQLALYQARPGLGLQQPHLHPSPH